jgi:multidrug efflux pump subunit AcrB
MQAYGRMRLGAALLSSIPGVAHVGVQGGEVAEFHADVDPERLRAQDINLADVATAVSHAAAIQAMGHVSDHHKLYLLLADNQPSTVEALRGIVVRADSHGLVRLGDIAEVTLSHVPQWIRVTADGQDAVLMQVFQQPDGNSFPAHRPPVGRWVNRSQYRRHFCSLERRLAPIHRRGDERHPQRGPRKSAGPRRRRVAVDGGHDRRSGRHARADAIIAGMLVQVPVVLLVMPVLYAALMRSKRAGTTLPGA